MPPIYYISENTINQLYAEYIGAPETLEVAEETEVGTDFYMRARAGLANLLSFVSGIEGGVEAGGSLESRTSSSESRTIEPTQESQTLELIRHLMSTEAIGSVSTIDPSSDPDLLYYFNTSLKLSVEGGPSGETNLADAMFNGTDRNRNPVMLSVTHSSPNIYFTGVTSPSNWVSPSILTNVHGVSTPVEFSGIIHPISVEENSGIPQVTCQYICIGPGSVFQSHQ